MKTNKCFVPALGFFAGLVVGISIIGLLAFTNAPVRPAPGAGIIVITVAEAHGFVNNYLKDAAPINQVVKGFTIDKAQLAAMKSLSEENPALTGFRIYFGKDNSAKRVGIVVGVDNAGKDAVTGSILNTESQNLSPCPPVCDVNSPIVH
jgi:hypothetical protein